MTNETIAEAAWRQMVAASERAARLPAWLTRSRRNGEDQKR